MTRVLAFTLGVLFAIGGTAAAQQPLVPPRLEFAGGLVDVSRFGAKCDSNGTAGNGTDDTAALQAAIDHAATRNGIAFIPLLEAGRACRITDSLVLTGISNMVGVMGAGHTSVIFNGAIAGKPAIKLVGKQHFYIGKLAISGKSGTVNTGIYMTVDRAGNRTAFGLIEDVALISNGVCINLQDANTITIRNVKCQASGMSFIPGSADAANLTHFVLADGANAVNDINIEDCNALARVTSAQGGATIKWATAANSQRVKISGCELERAAAGASTSVALDNVWAVTVLNNFLQNTDVTITNSRYVTLIANLQDGGALTVGNGAARGACVNVVAIAHVADTFTADSHNVNVSAINSTFWTAYTNQAADRITLSVLGAGSVAVANEFNGITERDRGRGLGAWISPRFNAGDFTSNAGNWTVRAPGVTTFRYTLLGKTMVVAVHLGATTVAGGPTQLRIAIPGGFTANTTTQNSCYLFDNGTAAQGVVSSSGGGGTLTVQRFDGAAFSPSSRNTRVQCQLTFEIQ